MIDYNAYSISGEERRFEHGGKAVKGAGDGGIGNEANRATAGDGNGADGIHHIVGGRGDVGRAEANFGGARIFGGRLAGADDNFERDEACKTVGGGEAL